MVSIAWLILVGGVVRNQETSLASSSQVERAEMEAYPKTCSTIGALLAVLAFQGGAQAHQMHVATLPALGMPHVHSFEPVGLEQAHSQLVGLPAVGSAETQFEFEDVATLTTGNSADFEIAPSGSGGNFEFDEADFDDLYERAYCWKNVVDVNMNVLRNSGLSDAADSLVRLYHGEQPMPASLKRKIVQVLAANGEAGYLSHDRVEVGIKGLAALAAAATDHEPAGLGRDDLAKHLLRMTANFYMDHPEKAIDGLVDTFARFGDEVKGEVVQALLHTTTRHHESFKLVTHAVNAVGELSGQKEFQTGQVVDRLGQLALGMNDVGVVVSAVDAMAKVAKSPDLAKKAVAFLSQIAEERRAFSDKAVAAAVAAMNKVIKEAL